MPIKILAKEVISQIAAGEVVERPASVVKELVENALDAGATQIAVEIRGGGTGLIRVTDNGRGIPAGEAALAFERHATSKIKSLDDLQTIGSLGFRGEALPSIAAVSDVEMLTGAEGEAAGTCLSLERGTVTSRKSQARPRGTTVTVRDLFRRVPARLKFLKSAPTENSHIANVVSQYALAYPEVAFSLATEGKETLRTSGRGRLLDSVVDVYGAAMAARMLAVKTDDSWQSTDSRIRVSGLVGAPEVGRAGRGYLSFFVNRRWVTSRLLAYAVEEAYHGLLMTGRHPVAVLDISLPPPEVDVNIHPAKSEVKFQKESEIFRAVQQAVRRTLVQEAPVPRLGEPAAPYAAPPAGTPELWTAGRGSAAPATAAPYEPSAPLLASLPVLRVVGQVRDCYIVAEGPDGVYLIDQHAAHERVRFDNFKEQRAQRAVAVQGLLEPATFEVSPRQDEIMLSCLEELTQSGFALEPFGERTYLVRAVPSLLGGEDWAAVLRETLDALAGEARNNWTEKMLASIACHGAVKSGQKLSDDEMRALVRQLEQSANPHTCPHGRPTIIHLGTAQLEKEFGRH
jgi:DNA mismatch repair protein MutL